MDSVFQSYAMFERSRKRLPQTTGAGIAPRSTFCFRFWMIDRVHAFISRLSPLAVCDACVAEKLELISGQVANLRVRQVVGSGGFERRRDICSLCFRERLVTRKL